MKKIDTIIPKKKIQAIFKNPLTLTNKVIHGLGRGSKMLGCPTANIKVEECYDELLKSFDNGVYVGWGKLKDDKEPRKSVVTIGTNPHFGDITKRTIEAHLIDYVGEDFYGEILKVVIVGKLRDMKVYNSIKELKEDIHSDIEFVKNELNSDIFKKLKENFDSL